MKKLKRVANLSWQDLGDHTIIIDSMNEKKVHHLNEVAAIIWEALESPMTEDDLGKIIAREYDVDKQTLLVDLAYFIGELEKQKLIETVP